MKYVVYENISDKFDNGHCWSKVKVLHLPQYKLSDPITHLSKSDNFMLSRSCYLFVLLMSFLS